MPLHRRPLSPGSLLRHNDPLEDNGPEQRSAGRSGHCASADSAAGVRVRTADQGDMSTVLRLWSVARSPFATTTDDAAAIEHLLAKDPRALLIAHLDEPIVGTAIAAWDGWRGHIYRLIVLPEYRLRGVGRALVTSGHERLRALGATRVNAAVGQHDSGPIAFWLAVGYRCDPGMSRFAKSL